MLRIPSQSPKFTDCFVWNHSNGQPLPDEFIPFRGVTTHQYAVKAQTMSGLQKAALL
jgi:hypothetical protein